MVRGNGQARIWIAAEGVVALAFILAAWTDNLTATAGKFAWTAVILMIYVVVAFVTDRYLP